jgi:hypothetical protein
MPPAAWSFVYDYTAQHIRVLPALEQQWLLAHVLSRTSLASIYMTESNLWWMTPFSGGKNQEREDSMRPIREVMSNYFPAISMALAMYLFRGGYLGHGTGQRPSRYILILPQVMFLAGGLWLGVATYANAGPWYALGLLRVQTGFAS